MPNCPTHGRCTVLAWGHAAAVTVPAVALTLTLRPPGAHHCCAQGRFGAPQGANKAGNAASAVATTEATHDRAAATTTEAAYSLATYTSAQPMYDHATNVTLQQYTYSHATSAVVATNTPIYEQAENTCEAPSELTYDHATTMGSSTDPLYDRATLTTTTAAAATTARAEPTYNYASDDPGYRADTPVPTSTSYDLAGRSNPLAHEYAECREDGSRETVLFDDMFGADSDTSDTEEHAAEADVSSVRVCSCGSICSCGLYEIPHVGVGAAYATATAVAEAMHRLPTNTTAVTAAATASSTSTSTAAAHTQPTVAPDQPRPQPRPRPPQPQQRQPAMQLLQPPERRARAAQFSGGPVQATHTHTHTHADTHTQRRCQQPPRFKGSCIGTSSTSTSSTMPRAHGTVCAMSQRPWWFLTGASCNLVRQTSDAILQHGARGNFFLRDTLAGENMKRPASVVLTSFGMQPGKRYTLIVKVGPGLLHRYLVEHKNGLWGVRGPAAKDSFDEAFPTSLAMIKHYTQEKRASLGVRLVEADEAILNFAPSATATLGATAPTTSTATSQKPPLLWMRQGESVYTLATVPTLATTPLTADVLTPGRLSALAPRPATHAPPTPPTKPRATTRPRSTSRPNTRGRAGSLTNSRPRASPVVSFRKGARRHFCMRSYCSCVRTEPPCKSSTGPQGVGTSAGQFARRNSGQRQGNQARTRTRTRSRAQHAPEKCRYAITRCRHTITRHGQIPSKRRHGSSTSQAGICGQRVSRGACQRDAPRTR